MNDHTFYIVSSYGATLAAVVIELWLLRKRRRRALAQAGQPDDRQLS
jgi:heme exporter protein CcmD